MANGVNANIDIFVDTQQAAAQLAALQKQITSLNASMAATSQGQMGTLGLQNVLTNFKSLNAEILSVASSTATLDKQLSKGQMGFAKSFGVAQRAFRGVGTEMELARQKAAALNAEYVTLGTSATGSMNSVVRMSNGAASRMQVFSQQIAIATRSLDLMGTRVLNWGKNMQWAGRQLMVGLTVPLTIFGVVATKAFMDVERAFVNFQRVYGDFSTSREETERMSQSIKELAVEMSALGYTAQETIELAGKAAATGTTGDALILQVEQATKLATLGQISQEQALNTMISLNTAFGLQGDKLVESVDFLNAVENQTVLALEDISEAIPLVAPVIQGLGGDVKDLAVMLTAMREGGVNANEGANALKTSLARLVTPTKQATETATQFGISLDNIVQNNAGDLMGMIYTLSDAMQGLSDLQQQQLLSDVFGKRQFARMGAMFSNLAKDGSQAARAMELVNAEASDLAALSDKELSAVRESTTMQFKSAVEEFKIALEPIGEMLLKFVTPLIDMGTKVLNWFNGLSEGIQRFSFFLAAAAGVAIPAFLMGLGLFGNLLGNLLNGFAKLGIGISGLIAKILKTGQTAQFLTNEEIEMKMATEKLANSQQYFAGNLEKTNAQLRIQSNVLRELQVQYNALASTVNRGRAGGVGPQFAPRAPLKFATGGKVPGKGNKDTIPALLTPGEMVINKSASQKHGAVLKAINSGNVGMYAKGKTDGVSSIKGNYGREYDLTGSKKIKVELDDKTSKEIGKVVDRMESYGESRGNIEETLKAGITEDRKWSDPSRGMSDTRTVREVRERVDKKPLTRRIRDELVTSYPFGETQANHQETRQGQLSTKEFLQEYDTHVDDLGKRRDLQIGNAINELAEKAGIDEPIVTAEPKGVDILRAERAVNQTGKRTNEKQGGGLGYVPTATARMDAQGLSSVRVGRQMEMAERMGFGGEKLANIEQGLMDSYDNYREKIENTRDFDVFGETFTPEVQGKLTKAQEEFRKNNPGMSAMELEEQGPKAVLLGEEWDNSRKLVAETNSDLAEYNAKLKANVPLLDSKVKVDQEYVDRMNTQLDGMTSQERTEMFGEDIQEIDIQKTKGGTTGTIRTRGPDGTWRTNKALGGKLPENNIGKKDMRDKDQIRWSEDAYGRRLRDTKNPRTVLHNPVQDRAAALETKKMMNTLKVSSAQAGTQAYQSFEKSFSAAARAGYMDQSLANHLTSAINTAEGPAKVEAMQLATNLMDALGPDMNPAVRQKAQSEWIVFGESLGEGLEVGLRGSEPELKSTATNIERIVSASFAKSAQIKSPSKKWYRYGVDLVRGLVGGMDSQKGSAVASAQSIEAATSGAMDNGIISGGPASGGVGPMYFGQAGGGKSGRKGGMFGGKFGKGMEKIGKGMRKGSVGGVGGQAMGGALMMGSMAPMMLADEEGKVAGMDSSVIMSMMMFAGMLQMFIPMLKGAGAAVLGFTGVVAAIAVAIAAIGFSIWKWRDNVDKAAKSSLDAGEAMANFGNSLTKLDKILGKTSLSDQQAEYRAGLTQAEKEVAAQFRDDLESEDGKAMVDELKKMNSGERERAMTSLVVAAVQSGKLSNDDAATFAKELGMQVGDTSAGSKAAAEAIKSTEGAAEMLASANKEAAKIMSTVSESGRISYKDASKQIGAATAGIKSYNEAIAKAEIDYRDGTLTYEEYIQIIREASAAQDRYNKVITNALDNTVDSGATKQAMKRKAEDVAGKDAVEEVAKNIRKSISIAGFGNETKDRFGMARSKYEADYIDQLAADDPRFQGKSSKQLMNERTKDGSPLSRVMMDEASAAADKVKELGDSVEFTSHALLANGRSVEEVTTLLNGIQANPFGRAADAMSKGEINFNVLNAKLNVDNLQNPDAVINSLNQGRPGLGADYSEEEMPSSLQYISSLDPEEQLGAAQELGKLNLETREAVASARLMGLDRYEDYVKEYGQEGLGAVEQLEGGGLTEEQIDYIVGAKINGEEISPEDLIKFMQDVESNANALKGVSNQLLVDLDIDPDDIADGERYSGDVDKLKLADQMMAESLPEDVDRTYASKFIVMDGEGNILEPAEISKNLVNVKKAWKNFSKEEDKSKADIVEYAVNVMPKVMVDGKESTDTEGAEQVFKTIDESIGLDKFNTLDAGTQNAILNIALSTNIEGIEDAKRAAELAEKLKTASITEIPDIAAELEEIKARQKFRKEAEAARINSLGNGNSSSGDSSSSGGGSDKDWFEQLEEDAEWTQKMYGKVIQGEKNKFDVKQGWVEWLRKNTSLTEEAIQEIAKDEEAMKKLQSGKVNLDKLDNQFLKKGAQEIRDGLKADKQRNKNNRAIDATGQNARVKEELKSNDMLNAMFAKGDQFRKDAVKLAKKLVVESTTLLDLEQDRVDAQQLANEVTSGKLNLQLAEEEYKYAKENVELTEKNATLNAHIAVLRQQQIDPLKDLIAAQQVQSKIIKYQMSAHEWNVKAYQREADAQKQIVDDMRRALDIRQRESAMLSHDEKLMGYQEEKINELYDERIEALDKTLELNQAIARAQQDQLGLADALSRGDVSAAAAAKQQMEQNSMQFASDQFRSQLETSRDSQIESLTGAESGLTKEQITERQRELEEDSYYTNLKIRDVEDEIYAINMKIRTEQNIINGYKAKQDEHTKNIQKYEYDILLAEQGQIKELETIVKSNEDRLKINEANKLQTTENARIQLGFLNADIKMQDAVNTVKMNALKLDQALGKSMQINLDLLKDSTAQANEYYRGLNKGNGTVLKQTARFSNLTDSLGLDAVMDFSSIQKEFDDLVSTNSTAASYNIPGSSVGSAAVNGIMGSVTNNYTNNNVNVNAQGASADQVADIVIHRLDMRNNGIIGGA